MGAWVVDGDPFHRGSLKFALTEQTYPQTFVMLVASLAEPWNVMESLNRWMEVLRTHVQRLRIQPETRREMEQKGDVLLYLETYLSTHSIYCRYIRFTKRPLF